MHQVQLPAPAGELRGTPLGRTLSLVPPTVNTCREIHGRSACGGCARAVPGPEAEPAGPRLAHPPSGAQLRRMGAWALRPWPSARSGGPAPGPPTPPRSVKPEPGRSGKAPQPSPRASLPGSVLFGRHGCTTAWSAAPGRYRCSPALTGWSVPPSSCFSSGAISVNLAGESRLSQPFKKIPESL
jgi:hypothetical protein